MTPVINNLIGTLSTQQYEIKPGDSDLKNIGELRYLNGVSYLNKKVYVYNGRFNQTVMQATNSVSFKNSSLINSTFGLQFTPRRYFK